MKTAVFCLILLMASTVQAQDRLDLYTDLNHSSCDVTDNSAFALVRVYAFVAGPVIATGVRFKAPVPACWHGATWVGDTVPDAYHVPVGDSQQDWSVAFFNSMGFCLSSMPILVGTINVIATGQSLACCDMISTQPAPFPFVFTDCSFGERPLVAGQKIVVNADNSCRCQSPLATESTTWGRVKSLYRR